MGNLMLQIQAATMGDLERNFKNMDTEEFNRILYIILGAVVLGLIVGLFIRSLIASGKKNEIYGEDEIGEIQSESATVVSKRIETSKNNDIGDIKYIAFQFSNGERKEFAIKDGAKFGMLVEGDNGVLNFRGKQFVDFLRKV